MAKTNEKICPGCGGKIIVTEESFVHRKNRYWHEECLKKKYPKEEYEVSPPIEIVKKPPAKPTGIKVCYYCGGDIDIDKEEYAKPVVNRYAHIKCYEENHTEDDEYIPQIYSYLKSLLIQYDYVQCEKQRVAYIKKNGYTNKGILYALKYFYEVKRQSADRSGNRIGIVPYVYDEAQAYYSELEKRKNIINKQLKKQIAKEKKKIEIKGEEIVSNKGYIDLDKLGE